jgi:hypothetical protein
MPLLLSEPPVALVALLGVLGLLVAGAGLVVRFAVPEQPWARTLGRALLGVGGLLLLLALAWLVAGFFIESPREEAVRRVNDMANAVTENNWAKFSENVSDSFEAKGRKKADLKGVFDQGGAYNLRAVAWDFAPTDQPLTVTEVVIQFEGKATAATGEPLMRHFEATFVKDPDGKFRMKTYKAFDFVQKNQPVDVP